MIVLWSSRQKPNTLTDKGAYVIIVTLRLLTVNKAWMTVPKFFCQQVTVGLFELMFSGCQN